MGYNVFVDFHHAGLLDSLIMLFEGRLNGNLYRPIGLEWHDRGFWRVYEHPFTIEQFLSTRLGQVEPPPQMYPDGTRPVNVVDKVVDGIYYCQDIDSGYFNKAITLDKFFEMPFDIVIASLPQHILPFKKLCEQHKNKPKLIYQIGNAWPTEAGLAKNIMASAIINNIPQGINFISYHQEFDLNLFKPGKIVNNKNISSFINCFDVEGFYKNDWQLFLNIERLMSDWNFRAYGGQCRDGARHGAKNVAKGIKNARFVWHTKAGGDGYGHIIHNVPACGKPLIVKKQYYIGKMADSLLEDGVTCLVIDGLSEYEIVDKIDYYNEDNRYKTLCNNAYNRFKQVVNFNNEANVIKNFLENLI